LFGFCVNLFFIIVTNIRENKLKGVEIYLVHSFRGFRPWLSGSIVSGLVVRQSIMVRRVWQSKAAHDMVDRKQTQQVKTGKDQGQHMPFQCLLSATHFLQKSPIFHNSSSSIGANVAIFLGFTMGLEYALDFLLWAHKQLSASSEVSQTSS
jgi:hypothetical protein